MDCWVEDETAVWAYLHGELDTDARQTFERRLAEDGTLRERCAEARRLDHFLRQTAPDLDQPDDGDDGALCERIVEAWARDQDAGSPKRGVLWRPPRRFFRPRTVVKGLAGLAAAALVVLAVYPLTRPAPRAAGAPTWAPVEIVPRLTRGPRAASPPSVIGMREAQRMQEALADSLAWASADRGAELPEGLVLSLHVRELPAGALVATVRATSTDGRTIGEWSGDYSAVDRFLERADASAACMVETLVQPMAGGE